MSTWPPTLAFLKADKKIHAEDDRDDEELQAALDAAVAFVERVRSGFDFADDPTSALPAPTADLVLGTVRLALRWYARRDSPDALVSMGEFGTARIPSFDPDIERLLGIGRYRGPVFV